MTENGQSAGKCPNLTDKRARTSLRAARVSGRELITFNSLRYSPSLCESIGVKRFQFCKKIGKQ